LLQGALDEAAFLGATLCTLHVHVNNFAAQRLYRRFGFEQIDYAQGYYGRRTEKNHPQVGDALVMGRGLKLEISQ
jgi:ribosomal protein S18 acetylase RimI-like enzyme